VKAVDTNVLARYLTRDSPQQADTAARILQEPTFVSNTVFLELAWLLRSRYHFSRIDVADALRTVLALPAVTVTNRKSLLWAVDRTLDGADIADMVHLVSADKAEAFVTFDKAIARTLKAASPIPIETLA